MSDQFRHSYRFPDCCAYLPHHVSTIFTIGLPLGDSLAMKGLQHPVRLNMRFPLFSTLVVTLAATSSLVALPAMAEMPLGRVRAANLARMEAERINGGLSRYFTANCMHQKGGGACMVNASADGYLFDFLGGAPGWEVYKQAATVETRILISPDGTRVVNIEYNGSPR